MCVAEVRPRRFFQVENDILNLTLETSESRVGQQLITHAFGIFLEEVLGFENVHVASYPDFYSENSSYLALQRLAGMDMQDSVYIGYNR